MTGKSNHLSDEPGAEKTVIRAVKGSDGTVTVPCCEAELVSVDVADIDLLLGFADGTYVIIPNGAIDALSDTEHPVVFVDTEGTAFNQAHFDSDHKATLGELFKMVGATEMAEAGSLRIKSDKLDDEEPDEDDEVPSDQPLPPAPETIAEDNSAGKGPGSDPILSTPELLDPLVDEPTGPIIQPRPSVFKPGIEVASVEPIVRIDPQITADDVINIAESDPSNLITITGSAAGSAIIGDRVTVNVGSYSVETTVQDDMTFSADAPGEHFVDPAYPDQVDVRLVSYDGKTASDTEAYGVDLEAPQVTISLESLIAGDGVVNIEESLRKVAIAGDVDELTGASDVDLAGAEVTLTINGTPYSGFVNSDGRTFNIDVPGSALAPTQGVEGASGTIDARIDVMDAHGNPAFGEDLGGNFAIDTLAPSASIQLDPDIGGDGIVNFSESLGDVTITGTVGGDVQDGETVTLLVNGQSYTGAVSAGGFSINVAGSDLATDPDSTITASVETFDGAGNNTTATTTASYQVDTSLPAPEIYLDPLTGDDVINQVEASDPEIPVTGRVGGDAQVGDEVKITVNGTLVATGFVSSDYTFSINVSGSDLAAVGDGGTGNVEATVTTSGTGGSVNQSVSFDYTVDLTAPSPTITVEDLTADNTINIEESNSDVVVKGSVGGAQAGDEVVLTVNGVEYSGLVRSDATFSINVQGSDLVADSDSVISARITTFDAAGNPGTGSVDKAFVSDILRPSASIDIDDNALNIGDSALVTITFNEPVTGFSNADLTVENGSLSDVGSVDGGITWTAILTPDSPVSDTSNLITLNQSGVTDLSGNQGSGTVQSGNYAIDTVPPDVVDVNADRSLLTDSEADGSMQITVTFSEAMDPSVDPVLSFSPDILDSLSLTAGTWDGTGTVFTASYTINDANVDLDGVTVDISGARDANGNIQNDYTAQPEFSIDTLNPTVVIGEDNTDGIVSFSDRVVNYTLTFSEEVADITAADLSISGGDLTGGPVLASDGLSATFEITAYDKSSDDLVVTVNDTIVDLNGNALVPATNTLTVDTLNPRVTISEDNLDGVVSDDDITVNYTLEFSTEVVSVEASDLTISGGTLIDGPYLSPDGLTATFSVTAFDQSTTDLVVTVNDTIVDTSGRPLVPNSNTLTVDTLDPTVVIADDNVDGVVSPGDQTVNYTLTFSEEVTGITSADLTVKGGTLTGDPVLSGDGLTATFSVTANDNSTTPLEVTVNNTILDLEGNSLQPATSSLPVDTAPPTGSVRVDPQVITDAEGNFIVVVEFNEQMDPSVFPTLIFSEDISSTLVKESEGWTSSNTKYFCYYSVLDADTEANVTVDVVGGQDVNGNAFPGLKNPATFEIDTLNPTVSISEDNIDGLVSDEDNLVNYTLTFSEEVTSVTASDLSITGGTLTSGPLLSADGLSATFSVTADDSSTADLIVTVNDTIVDVNGNALVPASNNLPVDTLNDLPDFTATLYTSSEFKVAGGTGEPVGATDSSPAGQSTRERIDGTTGDDSIVHNPAFSADASQWAKVLHIDFSQFTELTTIELIADPTVDNIPGFTLDGSGLTWDGQYTWTLTPDAATSDALIQNGLDLDVLYDVIDVGGPIDFDITVNISGKDGTVDYTLNKTLDMSWREAKTETDFDVIENGNQVMILPRDGLGVDIYADSGNDVVEAGAGDDTVYGGSGLDTIDGGTGNDSLYGGADADTITGSAGNDSVFGESGDDILGGGDGDDLLSGGDGLDSLDGGAGNDVLIGGAGGDILDGGADNDTASYEGSVNGISASLKDGLGSGGDADDDVYLNIENLVGGASSDILVGDGNDNILEGGAGDDTLIGGAGLNGDTLVGGLGNDTVSYAGSLGSVSASLESNSGTGGDADGDTYSGIENLIGGEGDDTLIGDDNDNILEGSGGGDRLQGGGGVDTASYAGAGDGVVAALDPALFDFQAGDAAGDSFSGIENLLGSDHDDTLFGNSVSNRLDGGLGNDALNAGAGDDIIHADQGSDTVRADIGNDSVHVSASAADLVAEVDGGDDVDTLVLENLVDGGTYDFTDLAGLDGRLENLEILDIRESADGRSEANTLLELTGQDVLNMVDTGTELTVLADSGDILDLSAFAAEGETYVENFISTDHTEYVISDPGGEIARIQWLTA